MHNYEVCVFQKDYDTQLWSKFNCFFKDVSATSQANDADQRCLDECFLLKPGGNQHEGTYDFLVWQVRLPTKDDNDEHETNKLVWAFEVPADDANNDVDL